MVRVAIIEDHFLMRELLHTLCDASPAYEVVAEAGDGPQAVKEIVRTEPDLVLLDLNLPGFDGFTVIERIRILGFNRRILVLSSLYDDYTIYRIEHAFVNGFIDKATCTLQVLRDAIRAVADKGVYFSDKYRKLRAARRADPRAFDLRLSNRERMILTLIGEFLEDHEIADRLNISDKTVEKHRFNIHAKLGLHSRSDLMKYARDHGFIRNI